MFIVANLEDSHQNMGKLVNHILWTLSFLFNEKMSMEITNAAHQSVENRSVIFFLQCANA